MLSGLNNHPYKLKPNNILMVNWLSLPKMLDCNRSQQARLKAFSLYNSDALVHYWWKHLVLPKARKKGFGTLYLEMRFQIQAKLCTHLVYFSVGQVYGEEKRLVSDSLLCGGCSEEHPKDIPIKWRGIQRKNP